MSEGRSPTVLIVDGDSQFAAQVAAHLAKSGIHAKLASDGYDAIRAVQQRSYDLILLGLQLRDRDGAEVLRLLRLDPHTANTPVHLLAAHGESEILTAAMRVGAQGVFRRDQQTPDAIAFDVVALLGGAATDGPGRGAAGNVPAEVDAVAQRFRTVRSPAADDATPAASRPALPPDPGKSPPFSRTTTSMQLPAAAQNTGVRTGLPEGFHSRKKFHPIQRPAASADPTAPPRPATGAGPGGVMGGAAGNQVPARPPLAPGAAPPRAPHAPVQQVFSYDTLLNHLVGQAPYLAEAMGLRTDFLCAACSAQLTLRMWPDAERPNGVRGYFFCPRCEPQ